MELEAERGGRPERAQAQRALACDITARVHGEEAAAQARPPPRRRFSGGPITDPAVLASLFEPRMGSLRADAVAAGIAFLSPTRRIVRLQVARRAGDRRRAA